MHPFVKKFNATLHKLQFPSPFFGHRTRKKVFLNARGPSARDKVWEKIQQVSKAIFNSKRINEILLSDMTLSTSIPRFPLVIGVAVGLLIGAAAGVGGYTFVYAKGGSYLTNDPQACANCHIMQDHFDAWAKSSHHAVAVCNDCHTPKDIIGKYSTKALNGWHHSYAFTTGDFHEPLMITQRNREITEKACRNCHQAVVQSIDAHAGEGSGALDCIRCHQNVGHMM